MNFEMFEIFRCSQALNIILWCLTNDDSMGDLIKSINTLK